MKPLRTFIFFTAVALMLIILALAMPRQGIPVTSGMTLKFASLDELRQEDPSHRSEAVEMLVAASLVTEDPESDFIPDNSVHIGNETDTLELMMVDPANPDSLKQFVYRLQMAEEGGELLDPFFRKLDGLLEGDVQRTRIMHFGDSQIEQDRMTALIRYRLQKQFGGSGTGLIPAIPLYSGHRAFRQEVEGEWLRYTYFGNRDSAIHHNAYGLMGAFTSVPCPSGGNWPSLQYSFNTNRRTGRFDRIRIFLHSYVDGAAMAIRVNDDFTDTTRQIPDGFSVTDYRHSENVWKTGLFANLPEGGRIYGISFESHDGLQVDNIAMRGGSGLIFSRMNREQQLRMMEYLSPGLLILQYGGNVVPYINADFYQRAFTRELDFLKDLCPGIPVIVIGPSDMSVKEKGKFVTYPNIEPVRDALRKAAIESGFAFWDLYEAMGGHNSMPSFVHADPPLASTDYIHFTMLGVNLVAEMFYNALMLEYRQYLHKSVRP